MILDQLFEEAGADSTAQRVADMLRQLHPNPSEATEREILAATSRVLSDQGMSDVQVRFYLRDPDFQSDIIEEVQARLQGVAEAMKPSDIPPTMRQRLTMKDIEAERPAGAYRFRVTFPDGATADFMDFEAAQQRAAADRGRISKLGETQKTAAKAVKGTNPRLERILKMLRANHPQAQNDLEALILDFRGQQALDRRDISRLDAENDAEEEDIARLEKMLAILKQRAKLAEYGSKKKGQGLRVQRDEQENITLAEQGKKDACYHKVKSRYKVWPSAYASGALVQCRKQGADNWGTGGSKK